MSAALSEDKSAPLSSAQLRDLGLAAEGAGFDEKNKFTRATLGHALRTGIDLALRGYVEKIGEFKSSNRSNPPQTAWAITLRGFIRLKAEESHRKHCAGCRLCRDARYERRRRAS